MEFEGIGPDAEAPVQHALTRDEQELAAAVSGTGGNGELGNAFSGWTGPVAAGIGFCVPLKSKTEAFLGKEALTRRKACAKRLFVGLEINATGNVGHGGGLHGARVPLGAVELSCRSPPLGKCIAMAGVDVAHADAGVAERLRGQISATSAGGVPDAGEHAISRAGQATGLTQQGIWTFGMNCPSCRRLWRE